MKQLYREVLQTFFKYIFSTVLVVFLMSSELLAQPSLIGLAPQGGDVFGTIYRADLNGGNAKAEHVFEGNAGAFPYYAKLCAANNGKLYGITSQGGRFNQGVLFSIDSANNSYQKIIDFNGSSLGASPRGSLILSTNGKLYGLCTQGGSNNNGTLFEFDPSSNDVVKLYDFNGTASGRFPYSSLVEVGNGDFFGLCYQGGQYNEGTLFEYKLSMDSLVKHVDFDGSVKGRNPFGSLCYASNGLLYGMTYQGGTNNFGTFFSFNPSSNVFSVKFDFNGSVLGSNPYGTPIEFTNKHLYALTYLGGSSNFGTLIDYDPAADTCVKHHDFVSGLDGRNPQGNLTIHNGQLYGLTPFGGSSNAGIIFTFNPSTLIYSKQLDMPGGKNGFNSYGTLTYNGSVFYGCTYQGGNISSGVVFKFAPSNNAYTKIIDFNSAKNGASPFSGLIKAKNGKYYGTTIDGGETHDGVLFEYDPELNVYSVKAEFRSATTGKNPYGSLCDAGNGNLYGLCYQGGSGNYGTAYRYDISNDTLILVNSLDDFTTGRNPYGSFVLAPNGNLYGIAAFGGAGDFGVLLKCNPNTNVLSSEFELIDTLGALSFGSLTVFDSVTLFGTTYQGGANDLGVIFKYRTDLQQYSVVHTFDGFNTGSYPQGRLVLSSHDSTLYGTTTKGGTNFSGVLFSYHPKSNSYTKYKDFSTSFGTNASGNLSILSNGNVVGTSRNGGSNNKGLLFVYNPSEDSLYSNTSFIDSIGTFPYGEVIEYCQPSRATVDIRSCYSYTSPSGKYTWTFNGTYMDTIVASTGCDSIMTINLSILDSSIAHISREVCDSFIAPNNQVLKTSGSYRIVIANSVGCDSIIYIQLRRLNSSYDTSINVCQEYVGPDGKTKDTTGKYTYHLVNYRGCDSVLTVNLKVLRSLVNTTVRACRKFTAADEKTYTKSGNYSAVLTNYLGCDSIIRYNLTIDTLNTAVVANDNVLTAQSPSGTFRWLNCLDDAFVTGATNKVFTATQNGNYAVEVSDNNCKDTSACVLVSNLNIEDVAYRFAEVYPNPSSGKFHIVIKDGHTSAHYSITDALGRKVVSGSLDCKNVNTISIDNGAGVYFLDIVIGNSVSHFKLVVQ